MSIYAKTADGWVPLTGGSREGAPGAPVITNPEGGGVIYFTPGTEGAAGPTLAYGSTIEPSNDGETVVVDQETLEVAVEGTSPSTDYVVSVYGVNVAGVGQQSVTDPFQMNYNSATGGTVTVVDDYNGTGETWQVHDFGNSGGTFIVESGPKDFRVMAAGQPGAGGPIGSGRGGGGGGGGEVLDVEISFTAGVYPVTVNAVNGVSARGGGSGMPGWNVSSGAGRGGASGNGNPGGPQSADTFNGGGGGGSGGAGVNSGGNQCTGGGSGTVTNILGYNASFGAGGGGGAQNNGCSGQTGKVVIAYQIGISSTTQIKNAQAKQAARSQGYDDGYDVGVADGRVQRNAEIAEAAADVKEAVEAAAAVVEAKPKRTRKKAV